MKVNQRLQIWNRSNEMRETARQNIIKLNKTDEAKERSRKKLIKYNKSSKRREKDSQVSEKMKGIKPWNAGLTTQDERVKVSTEKLTRTHRTGRHSKAVEEEIKNLEANGFRCLNLCKSPIPDIIAIKDGLPYAVEVQFGYIYPKKYLTNNPNSAYADIIWIKRK